MPSCPHVGRNDRGPLLRSIDCVGAGRDNRFWFRLVRVWVVTLGVIAACRSVRAVSKPSPDTKIVETGLFHSVRFIDIA